MLAYEGPEFRRYINEERGGDAYAHEEVHYYEFHMAAALGFDVANGQEKSLHVTGALGVLSTLRSVLIRE